MPKKTFAVSIERLEDLSRALGRAGKSELTDAELENLVSLAVQLWIGTLIGPGRYRSMTELYVAWLREIYERHLGDEEPHERRLFARLNFPFGQAAYLARVLREEQPSAARRKSLENLVSTLAKRVSEARKWVKDGRGMDRMSITITKAARRELELVMAALIEAGTQVQPLRGEGSMGDYVAILIVAADVEQLANEVKKAADQLKKGGGATA